MSIFTIYFIFCSLAAPFQLPGGLKSMACQGVQVTDTHLVKFVGLVKKASYSANRNISEAPFRIKNLSRDTLKVSLMRVTLLRGTSEDDLQNGRFDIFMTGSRKKCREFVIKPGSSADFDVKFDPYTIYAGSTYTVKAYILINGQRFEAVSPLEIYRLNIGDKNKYKN